MEVFLDMKCFAVAEDQSNLARQSASLLPDQIIDRIPKETFI